MSPRQLEYFLEIYNQRSIKKAAEKLIISPQAVSKTIREIEEELQVELFVRGKKFLEPTIEAEYLKNHAIKILEEYEQINSIKKSNMLKRKSFTVYSVDGFLDYVTIEFIEAFQAEFPDILLNVIEMTENDLIKKLETREIDSAIITTPLDKEVFSHTYLYSSKNCLVINKNNPLAKKETISQRDLDQKPIAGKGWVCSCYSSNVKKLFQKNINPLIKLETTNTSLIIKMAERDLAIGIVLDYIAFSANNENVVVRYFEEKNQEINVFWIEHNYAILTKQEQDFREFLCNWIKENRLNKNL